MERPTDEELHARLRQALSSLVQSGKYLGFVEVGWESRHNARCDLMGEFMRLNQHPLTKGALTRVHKLIENGYVDLLLRNRTI